MNSRHLIAWEIVVVLLLAVVLTVEWWRSGELEHLNRRVDELEHARRGPGKKPASTNGEMKQ